MEPTLDWSLRKCLVWETEKPFRDRPRESPAFAFQGCVCHLILTCTPERGVRYYSLKMKSNSGYDTFKVCNVTVHVKRRTGCIVLSQTSAHQWWVSPYSLWSLSEPDILKEIRDFESEGLLRFFLFFDDCGIEHAISLEAKNDKSIQTEKNADQHHEAASKEQSVQTPQCFTSMPCLEDLSRDLAKLMEERSSTDVQLRCGDQTVSAHKNVLSTRSQVFAKMLQSDMAESLSGQVEIRDMDEAIFRHFIRYLYTGRLPELTTNTAISFYEAGDRYDMKGLMQLCSDFLVDSLTPENACEVLILADNHSDRKLREVVLVYILEQKVPLMDQVWQVFCKAHPLLAIEVVNRFCKLHFAPKECEEFSL